MSKTIQAVSADDASARAHHGLVVSSVYHRYGDIVATDAVDLDVSPGEVHCLLGPSGSGKSTLLRLVAGLEALQRGSIRIAGRSMGEGRHQVPPEARSVGFVFQDYALFPHLDARRNVAFGLRGGSRRQRLATADAWLGRVGLGTHLSAMPHTLSGGEQQRVALARALATEPTVMLLDEPFSGLDRRLRTELRTMSLELLRETGCATLMITHDPQEAMLGGDRISVIRGGRILQTGTPEQLYRRSASIEVAQTFGPVNVWRATAIDGTVVTPWGDVEAMALGGVCLDGEVDVVIRADGLRLHESEASAMPGVASSLARGTILEVTPSGTLATLRVEIAGHAFEIHDWARRGWRAGQNVVVSLYPEAAVVLPG